MSDTNTITVFELPKTARITKYQTRSTIITSAGMGAGATLLAIGIIQKKNPLMIVGAFLFTVSYIYVDNPTYK